MPSKCIRSPTHLVAPLLGSSLLLLDSLCSPLGELRGGIEQPEQASKSIGGFSCCCVSRRAQFAVLATSLGVGALLTLGQLPAAYATPEPVKPSAPAPIPRPLHRHADRQAHRHLWR